MPAQNRSSRRNLLEAFKKEAKLLRNSRYAVRRGAVNWGKWDFAAKPFGFAIMFDEGTFMKDHNSGTLTFEIFAKLTETEAEDGITEGLTDEFLEDVRLLCDVMFATRDSNGDPLLYGYDTQNASFVEVSDADDDIQGVVVSIPVTY